MTLTRSDTHEVFFRRISCLFGPKAKPAERYLSIGGLVRDGLRLGLSIQVIAVAIALPASECLCALRYAESSVSLRFQALVEDWSWAQIVRAVSAGNADPEIKPTMMQLATCPIPRSTEPPFGSCRERQRRLFGSYFEI